MNVFVLNSGRCGSTTFTAACAHITNYTSAHESRTHLLGSQRLAYPPRHIEADNRLSWLLGRLDAQYGDSAFYVHLRRNRQDTAESFVRRYQAGIIRAYREQILLGLPEETDPLTLALDYWETVNRNIELFLRDKSRVLTIELEDCAAGFRDFWQRIGASGDLDASLAEFGRRYNASRLDQDAVSGAGGG